MRYQNECSKSSLSRVLKDFCSEGKTRFYLSEFVSEARVSVREAEDFFIPLLKTKEMEGELEVRCPSCGKDLGIFKKLGDIPEEITCEICGSHFSRSMEYVEIVLEVKGKFFRAQKSFSNFCRKNTHERRTGTAVGRGSQRT